MDAESELNWQTYNYLKHGKVPEKADSKFQNLKGQSTFGFGSKLRIQVKGQGVLRFSIEAVSLSLALFLDMWQDFEISLDVTCTVPGRADAEYDLTPRSQGLKQAFDCTGSELSGDSVVLWDQELKAKQTNLTKARKALDNEIAKAKADMEAALKQTQGKRGAANKQTKKIIAEKDQMMRTIDLFGELLDLDLLKFDTSIPSIGISLSSEAVSRLCYIRADHGYRAPIRDNYFYHIEVREQDFNRAPLKKYEELVAKNTQMVETAETPMATQKKMKDLPAEALFQPRVLQLFEGWDFAKKLINSAIEDEDLWTQENKGNLDDMMLTRARFSSAGSTWVWRLF